MIGSIWAVVSSFHPEDLVDVVGGIAGQVDGVVVVDDGSGPSFAAILETVRAGGARVLVLPENMGIATALNTGIREAFAHGADAVVTFDQDSHVEAGFIDRLVQLYTDLERKGIAAGPVVPQFFANVDQARRTAPDGGLIAENCIQSGMLISREVAARLGPFREDFFIDLVDTEYAMRSAAMGSAVRAVAGLRLEHRLGARYRRTAWSMLPIPRTLTLSSPFRYYYRSRNRIMLEHDYRHRFPLRLLRDGLTDRLHFVIALLIARPRREMWAVLWGGVRDGRHRKGGRAPDNILRRANKVRWAADRLADD